ncbi:MAG TPA: hypothetical protein VHY48_07805 [Acidobacteriaceae bacterium]|jgi:hypothetical protein|nr:hypothetical protein [Acidobacteriaceae bacterium]
MTREEMLRRSGLTEAQFKDLVRKVEAFLGSLDPAQRAAIKRSFPTADQVAASFGPALTVEQLGKLLGVDVCADVVISERGMGLWAESQ